MYDGDPCRDDAPKEACGVFGVYAPGQPVAHLTYLGLYALQHRGQESAGIAVADGRSITVVKDMGLVPNVFNERTLGGLPGDLAIGHTRYSTTGSSTWRNAQPVFREAGGVHFALGHNGNLTNTDDLADEAGMLPGTVGSDSDLIAELLAREIVAAGDRPPRRAGRPSCPGCAARSRWSLVDQGRVVGGARPQRLPTTVPRPARQRLGGRLRVAGARHRRRPHDPRARAGRDGRDRRRRPPLAAPFPGRAHRTPTLCAFEFVYFARPDAQLYGRSVAGRPGAHGRAPGRTGAPPARLACRLPGPAMVMPVPESGVPAAQGFARVSGIPYGDGLVKNRYIGRTFIAPSQDLRRLGVRLKLNPLRENIAGKRLVVVDDSIVRGTTTRAVVAMLRQSGRGRGAPADHVAALPVALLLRHGHRRSR